MDLFKLFFVKVFFNLNKKGKIEEYEKFLE